MAGHPHDSHGRLAYLLHLTDHLRIPADPLDMQRSAARLLGEHLQADGACFAVARDAGAGLQVTAEWRRDGVIAGTGWLRPAQFGRLLGRPVRNGAVASIADLHNDERIDAALHGEWKALGARAIVLYPVVRQERLSGALLVHQSMERRWTDAEIAMVTETAERVADALAHAHALRELRESEEQRSRLLEAERLARIEAELAVRAKDEFLATLSHELRSPLSNILSWARLLQTKFIHDEGLLRQGLTVINENALAQGRLLSDLLDSSSIASGKFTLEPEPLDLNDLVESICSGVQPTIDAKGLTLSCTLAGSAAPLFADGARLRQVVVNLLSNAVKFTPAGGRIDFTVKRVEGAYEIQVRDSGEGIAPELLPLVFERFRQADTARSREYGGLGLGLSIARQIVEMHGGSIDARSAGLGLGACFTVTLPIRSADDASRARPAEIAPGSVAPDVLAGLRLLAVEDQPDMRDLLQRLLHDHGAQVQVVGTAAEALALLRPAPDAPCFDVLISDIGLPSRDGYQLIQEVRKHPGLDAVRLPAIAVTAYGREEDRQRALVAGFQAHLTKPYDTAALISLVKGLARFQKRP